MQERDRSPERDFTMTNKPSIGFIGLGLMGSAMVERMQKLGYPMTVIANRSRSPLVRSLIGCPSAA